MTRPGLVVTPRDRRVLLLGAVIIGALLIGSRGLPAWRRWQQRSEATADSAALELARQQAALVGQRAASDSLTVRRRRFESLRATWLEGDTPAAAGAALAGQISKAGEHAGVTIGALDIRIDTSVTQSFVPVRVHATATGDIQGVANLLSAIEGARVAMAVRAFSIDAADPAPVPNRAELLHVELTVEGPWHRARTVMAP